MNDAQFWSEARSFIQLQYKRSDPYLIPENWDEFWLCNVENACRTCRELLEYSIVISCIYHCHGLHTSVHLSPLAMHTHLSSARCLAQLQARISRMAWGAGWLVIYYTTRTFSSLSISQPLPWNSRVLLQLSLPFYHSLVVCFSCLVSSSHSVYWWILLCDVFLLWPPFIDNSIEGTSPKVAWSPFTSWTKFIPSTSYWSCSIPWELFC